MPVAGETIHVNRLKRPASTARFSGQSGRGAYPREAESWGGQAPYEQNVQPADVGAKTRSAAAFTQRPAIWRGVGFIIAQLFVCLIAGKARR